MAIFRWAEQLSGGGAIVDGFSFDGLLDAERLLGNRPERLLPSVPPCRSKSDRVRIQFRPGVPKLKNRETGISTHDPCQE